MTQAQYKDLRQACKKERDPRVRDRIRAIHMMQVRKYTVEEAADVLIQSTTWVDKRPRRYREGGIDAPRCRRPARVPDRTNQKILNGMGGKVTPRVFLDTVRQEAG